MPGPTITGRITRTTAIIGTRMSIIGIAGTGIIITTTTTGITTIGINDPLVSPNPSSRMMLACTVGKSSKKIPRMKYFALLLLTMSSGVSAADRPPIGTPAMPPVKRRESTRETFQGPDRTITWHPWQERAEFRVRTGDRYLGHEQWEHYLGFEEHPSSAKEIKLSRIHLASEAVPDVFLRPGTRYAIVKVTNSTMTVRKGRWGWTAQEVRSRASFHVYAW